METETYEETTEAPNSVEAEKPKNIEPTKTIEDTLYPQDKNPEESAEEKDNADEKDVDTLEKAVENNDKAKETDKDKEEKSDSKDSKEPKEQDFTAKDLTVPDGLELDDGFVDSVVAFAKEHKLSKDQAQKLIDRDTQQIENYYKSIDDQKSKWLDEIKADEKYGGENLKNTSVYSQWALNQFGSDEFKQELKGTQWEFHPGLIKLLANVGKKFAPKDLVNPGMAAPRPKTMEERIYGTTEG